MISGIIAFIVLAAIIVGCYKSGIRRTSDNVLGGVCGGLAKKFDIGVGLARVLAVLALICTGGTAILLYVLLWIVLPTE